MLAFVQDEPSEGTRVMNTVTVSFLIITSRNFLSQRQSCRSCSYLTKNKAFGSKKHLNFPSLLQISKLLRVALESVSSSETRPSFPCPQHFVISRTPRFIDSSLSRWMCITNNAKGTLFCTPSPARAARQSSLALEMANAPSSSWTTLLSRPW